MIKINLLPEEFRVKVSNKDYAQYFKIALGVGVLFVVLTFFFYIDYLFTVAHLSKLEKKWVELQPQSDQLSQLQKEVDGNLKQEKDFMQQFVTTQRPLTHLLEWTSELLPKTAWLSEIKLSQDKGVSNYLVKGLCLPSKEKTSIQHIGEYLDELKKRIQGSALSLQTTRIEIAGVEVTQFTSNFKWGEGVPQK